MKISYAEIFCFGMIAAIFTIQIFVTSGNEYDAWLGRELDTQGVVTSVSAKSNGSQVLYVLPQGFGQQFLVRVYSQTLYQVGDLVWIRGQVLPIENFSGFDYQKFLRGKKVFAEVKAKHIIILKSDSSFTAALIKVVTKYLISKVEQKLKPEFAAIVLGMLLGQDDKLPAEVKGLFNQVGLTHILVVSGYNMTIVAQSATFLARWLGRRKVDILAILMVLIYSLIVGFSASVVRAAIMSIAIIFARLVRRPNYSLDALAWAVGIMLYLNHNLLFYDIGFQLSVAATYGVVVFNQSFNELSKNSFIKEVGVSSTGAIIFTWPISSYYLGSVSIWALPINIIILPIVPITMLMGALLYLPGLDFIATYFINFVLEGVIFFLNFLQNNIQLSLYFQAQLGFLVAYYLILILLLYVIKYWLKKT